MAIVQLGPLVHSIKGKLQGSVFRNNTYGVTLYSNNWSKRGTGARHKEARFTMAQIKSTWRDLTPEERASWQQPLGHTSARFAGYRNRRKFI